MDGLATAWDARIEALLTKLPRRIGNAVEWLRTPYRRIPRICVAVLLVIGGCLWFLPILGLWMLPLGLALLSEDIPGMKPHLESGARRVERAWHRLLGRRRATAPDDRGGSDERS